MRLLPASLTVRDDHLGVGAARHPTLGKRILATQLCQVVRQCVVRFILERRLAVSRLIAGVGRVVAVDVSGYAAVLMGV